jgi:uncharacterized protein (TIGR02284 family)
MTTLVGTQKNLADLLDALLELDYDAIEAYRAAIDRIGDPSDKAQLGSFLADHERHIRDLTPLVESLGKKASKGPDIKQWLTKGKVVIMGLAGDNAILHAMKTNEDDTNKAYERATSRTDLTSDVRYILERNLADERRHRAWLEARLGARKAAPAT